MQVFLDQAGGVQAAQQAHCRSQHGQGGGVIRRLPRQRRPRLGKGLGGIEEGGQQCVAAVGQRRRGEQRRGWYGGRDQCREAGAFLPPVFLAAPSDEELGEDAAAIDFGFADQTLARQHAQQTAHADLSAVGQGDPEG